MIDFNLILGMTVQGQVPEFVSMKDAADNDVVRSYLSGAETDSYDVGYLVYRDGTVIELYRDERDVVHAQVVYCNVSRCCPLARPSEDVLSTISDVMEENAWYRSYPEDDR